MKPFETCDCNRLSQKCVMTGINFLYNEEVRTGDAFYCHTHHTLNIFGIPSGDNHLIGVKTIFTGFLLEDRGRYSKTEDGGLIELGQSDIDYISKYDSCVFEEDCHV